MLRFNSIYLSVLVGFSSVLLLGISTGCAQRPAADADTSPREGGPLRAGMIGLDTSHVIAFTRLLNDPNAEGDLADVQIVAGFPGGTDIPPSRDRVENFTRQLSEMGIEICDSIAELLEKVDVVLLESVDGRPHLQQARPVIEAGKPLFIDKPLAGSLADAVSIFELAQQHNVPCFSSSSLRFTPGVLELQNNGKLSGVTGAVTWGPCSLQPPMPDLYFYGVHGVELLYAIMGTGCESVTRAATEGTDVVTGVWQDGRIGTYRGIRTGKSEFGATVFREDEILQVDQLGGYEQLVAEIARFFKTGKPPVSAEETLELFAFLDAAEKSKQLGGQPVSIAETLAAARAASHAATQSNRQLDAEHQRQLTAAGVDPQSLRVWTVEMPSDIAAWEGDEVVCLLVSKRFAAREVVLPRLNNPVRQLVLLGTSQPEALSLAPSPQHWTITLPADRTGDQLVLMRLIGDPYVPVNPRTIAQAEDRSLDLPAHEAVVHGEKLCYEPLPHKNTLGYWVRAEDWAEWYLDLDQGGAFQVRVYQGCGQGQGGSRVAFDVGEQRLEYVVEDTGHFQNFQWRDVGVVQLPAGQQSLSVRPVVKAQQAVMDIRQVQLLPLEASAVER